MSSFHDQDPNRDPLYQEPIEVGTGLPSPEFEIGTDAEAVRRYRQSYANFRNSVRAVADAIKAGWPHQSTEAAEALYLLLGDAPPADTPLAVLQEILDSGEIADHHYHIRENEGEGWDGPRMLRWNALMERAEKFKRPK